MLLRAGNHHYHPLKKSYCSPSGTERCYRAEGLLPEVEQLLCSVENTAHPKSWHGALGGVICSVTEMIIFETAYGSYCTNGFLKLFKIFPHHRCELEKMLSLRDSPPAMKYHSVPYAMSCLVLFLKPVCFWGGKCFIILVHLSVEKHFF